MRMTNRFYICNYYVTVTHSKYQTLTAYTGSECWCNSRVNILSIYLLLDEPFFKSAANNRGRKLYCRLQFLRMCFYRSVTTAWVQRKQSSLSLFTDIFYAKCCNILLLFYHTPNLSNNARICEKSLSIV